MRKLDMVNWNALLRLFVNIIPSEDQILSPLFMSSSFTFHDELMGQVFLFSIESLFGQFSTCSRFYSKAVKTKDHHKPHNYTLSNICFSYKFLIERTTTRQRKPGKINLLCKYSVTVDLNFKKYLLNIFYDLRYFF